MQTKHIPDTLIRCFEDLSIVSKRYRNALKADDVDDNLMDELQGDLKSFYKCLIGEVALPSAALQITTSQTLTNINHSPNSFDIDGELMESALDNLTTITMNTILDSVQESI